ncbi:MAG: transposase [Rubrobacter sp.]|nr:transposase [Rubrobacter sp.]
MTSVPYPFSSSNGQSPVYERHEYNDPRPQASLRVAQPHAKSLPTILAYGHARTLSPGPGPRAARARQPKEEHEAIQFARKRQKTEEFVSLYSRRAGIEGTVSQGVRAFRLRQARYRGLNKTNLQELATPTAVNMGRIANWLNDIPTAATRHSLLAALAPAS